MKFKNAKERHEETKRNQTLMKQEKERVLDEFWKGEPGEFLINEIEKEITYRSEKGLFEVEIKYSSLWQKLTIRFPDISPNSDTVAYDVVAMYEDNGFEAIFLDGLIPRIIIKWEDIWRNLK